MQIPELRFLHVFHVSYVFDASNPVFRPTSNVALHFSCRGDGLHTMVICKTPGVYSGTRQAAQTLATHPVLKYAHTPRFMVALMQCTSFLANRASGKNSSSNMRWKSQREVSSGTRHRSLHVLIVFTTPYRSTKARSAVDHV